MKIKTNLRTDNHAEVMYPFVLIIALVAILAFVMSGVSQYAQSGNMTSGDTINIENPFGMYNYTTIDADPLDSRYIEFDGGVLQGYKVTDDDVLDYVPYPTDEDPFIFTDDDGDLKYVHIIRNNRDYDPGSADIWKMYLDFISIRRDVANAIYWESGESDWNDQAIPFTVIDDHFNNNTNASTTDFQLGDSQDTLFINVTTPGQAAFVAGLWGNEFNLFYGWAKFRIEEVDFWGAISMILYADIPGVNDTIDFLLHTFVISTIVYVVFRMGVMMTPFLGG